MKKIALILGLMISSPLAQAEDKNILCSQFVKNMDTITDSGQSYYSFVSKAIDKASEYVDNGDSLDADVKESLQSLIENKEKFASHLTEVYNECRAAEKV